MVRILNNVEESMYELLSNVTHRMVQFGHHRDSVLVPVSLEDKAKVFLRSKGVLITSTYYYRSSDFVRLTIRSD